MKKEWFIVWFWSESAHEVVRLSGPFARSCCLNFARKDLAPLSGTSTCYAFWKTQLGALLQEACKDAFTLEFVNPRRWQCVWPSNFLSRNVLALAGRNRRGRKLWLVLRFPSWLRCQPCRAFDCKLALPLLYRHHFDSLWSRCCVAILQTMLICCCRNGGTRLSDRPSLAFLLDSALGRQAEDLLITLKAVSFIFVVLSSWGEGGCAGPSLAFCPAQFDFGSEELRTQSMST